MEQLSAAPRKRGRPPRTIDQDQLIAAVERLLAEGGIDAVTIERTAHELDVSRATLYRSVPTRAHLLGILFVRMHNELDEATRKATRRSGTTPRQRLEALTRVQIEAGIRIRYYFFVYFDASQLPAEDYEQWKRWADRHERVWVRTVADAIAAGDLPPGDPKLTTRLILGMLIWVANWFRTREGFTADEIHARALELIGLRSP